MSARRLPVRALLVLLLTAAAFRVRARDWPQWGSDPAHEGASGAAGQPLGALLADVVYDPFVPLEVAESGGNLLVHYAVPLLDGSNAYMAFKSGSYVPCIPPGSGLPFPCGPDAWALQTWNVRKLTWHNGTLSTAWSFASDWKPEPAGGALSWEPVFHAVLSGDFVYVPGLSGTVFKLSRTSGSVVARINPFGIPDNPTYVAGGLAADTAGNVYYNAIQLDRNDPWGSDAPGAWLVKITADGTASKADFSSLVPGAPSRFGLCQGTFSTNLPWPPSAEAIPPNGICGSQRPGINVIPAAAPDGTIYTVSRAHFNGRYSYLVAVHPDLTPAWSASLRNILNDGCDVGLPSNGMPGGCRAGSARGVDPATNDVPAGQVSEVSSSSPVVLPDGGVLYGTFTAYNYRRGHLFKFTSDGRAAATYDFGWDSTPAVYRHDGTYSILMKDNHYGVGSYCSDPRFCPPEKERYDFVSLDANLSVEWKFTATNTFACRRDGDGNVTCVSDHPDGFEWCINQPAVDGNGVTYANSEDGFLYAIGPTGTLDGRIFLDLAVGASYTPVSISSDGLIYAQNNGHLFVVGNPLRPSPVPVGKDRRPGTVGPHSGLDSLGRHSRANACGRKLDTTPASIFQQSARVARPVSGGRRCPGSSVGRATD